MSNFIGGFVLALAMVAAVVSGCHEQIYQSYRVYRGIEASERAVDKIKDWRQRIFSGADEACGQCRGKGTVPGWRTTPGGSKVRGPDVLCPFCGGTGSTTEQDADGNVRALTERAFAALQEQLKGTK